MELLGFLMFFLLLVGLGYCTYYVGKPQPGSEDKLFDPTDEPQEFTVTIPDHKGPLYERTTYSTQPQTEDQRAKAEEVKTGCLMYYDEAGKAQYLPMGSPGLYLGVSSPAPFLPPEDPKLIAKSWEDTCKAEKKAETKRKKAKAVEKFLVADTGTVSGKQAKVYVNGKEVGVLNDFKPEPVAVAGKATLNRKALEHLEFEPSFKSIKPKSKMESNGTFEDRVHTDGPGIPARAKKVKKPSESLLSAIAERGKVPTEKRADDLIERGVVDKKGRIKKPKAK